MPVNLSIKNAPDEVVRRLKARATRNHRSLQGELRAIIEAAAKEEEAHRLTPAQLLAKLRAAGVSSPSESVEIVRKMRDSRHGNGRR